MLCMWDDDARMGQAFRPEAINWVRREILVTTKATRGSGSNGVRDALSISHELRGLSRTIGAASRRIEEIMDAYKIGE